MKRICSKCWSSRSPVTTSEGAGAIAVEGAERLVKEKEAGGGSQFARQGGDGESQAQSQRKLVGGAAREGRLRDILLGGGLPDAQLDGAAADGPLLRLGGEFDVVVATAGKLGQNLLHVVFDTREHFVHETLVDGADQAAGIDARLVAALLLLQELFGAVQIEFF